MMRSFFLFVFVLLVVLLRCLPLHTRMGRSSTLLPLRLPLSSFPAIAAHTIQNTHIRIPPTNARPHPATRPSPPTTITTIPSPQCTATLTHQRNDQNPSQAKPSQARPSHLSPSRRIRTCKQTLRVFSCSIHSRSSFHTTTYHGCCHYDLPSPYLPRRQRIDIHAYIKPFTHSFYSLIYSLTSNIASHTYIHTYILALSFCSLLFSY